MDQGGEMARNTAMVSLFDKYGYVVRQTSPGTSNQNSPDEVPHIYIREEVRSLI